MLHIVIVSYCVWEELEPLVLEFRSVQIPMEHHLHIADNQGQEEIQSHADSLDGVTYHSFNNPGYGGAFNRVLTDLEISDNDLFIICNDDLRLEKDSISDLLEGYELAKDKIDKVGPVSPSYYDSDRRLQMEYYDQSKTLVGEVNQVEFAPGALWVMDGEFLRTVGGFVPDFFMYAEDRELAYRSIAYGFQPVWIQSSMVHHNFHYPPRSNRMRTLLEKNTIAAVYLDVARGRSQAIVFAIVSLFSAISTFHLRRVWFVIKGFVLFLSDRKQLRERRNEIADKTLEYRFIR